MTDASISPLTLAVCNTAPNLREEGVELGSQCYRQKARNYLYNAIEIETLTRSIKEPTGCDLCLKPVIQLYGNTLSHTSGELGGWVVGREKLPTVDDGAGVSSTTGA